MIALDEGGRGAKTAVPHAVPPALVRVVERVWTLPGPGPDARRWRIVADPNPHLIVHRDRGGATRVSVVGSRTRWLDVDVSGRAWTAAVRLRVGTLGPLLRIPASELIDCSVPADLAFAGSSGRALVDRLGSAATPGDAAELLLDVLVRRDPQSWLPDWRVRGLMSALRSRPGTGIAEAAELMGVSVRTLRDVTRNDVGIAPKTIQRLHRLLRGLLAMRAGGSRPDVPAAVGMGFTDHAHLVHECRSLLGETPRVFLARGRPADSYKTGSPTTR